MPRNRTCSISTFNSIADARTIGVEPRTASLEATGNAWQGDLTQNKPQITQSSIWLPRVERGTYVSPANQADGGEYQTGCGHGGRRRSRRHRPAATKE